MVPGEVFVAEGELVQNAGREALVLEVANTGDRPVQVGSHYHFAEANPGLRFDRAAARGLRGRLQRLAQLRTTDQWQFSGRSEGAAPGRADDSEV